MTYPERQYKVYTCDLCTEIFSTNTPKRGKDGKRRCPDCQREREKLQSKKAPLSRRDTFLRKSFGIGLVQYQQKLKDQGYVCAVCKRQQEKPALAVDHNHATLQVRGLLCINCNFVIGHAQDSILILQSAIDYLKKHGATT